MNLHQIFARTTPIQNNAQLALAAGTGTILTTVFCGSLAKDLYAGNYADASMEVVGCIAAIVVDVMGVVKAHEYLTDYNHHN